MSRKKKPFALVISYIFLIIFAVIMIYPLVWMLGACFKTNQEIFGTISVFPKHPVTGAFKKGWQGVTQYNFGHFLINSFKLVLPTVVFTVLSSVTVAYGFARFNFPFKKFLFMLMLSTLMLPSTVILIPRYIMFKKFNWLNSYLPFWIPALLACNSFFNYQMVQFIRGIPRELDESAKIDGCSSFRILIEIILPLCKAAIFSVIVFQFVWTWNNFLEVLVYVSNVKQFPVALGLRMSLDNSLQFDWNQIMAMSIVAIAPPVVLFFSAQRYFVEGIATTGSKN